MPFSREEALAALTSLNPAPIFLDAYRMQRLPENLDFHIGAPAEFFLAPATQDAYTQGRFVPLLDDGCFSAVLMFDPATRELREIELESPQAAPTPFRHWQHYLAHLMLRIGESIDEVERLRRIAALVGFEHAALFFDFLARSEGLRGAAWSTARDEFLAGASA